MLFIGCSSLVVSQKENETLPKAVEDLKLVTIELFTYIVTGFTPVLPRPRKGEIAQKAAQLLIVLFPFSYTVVSDTAIKILCKRGMFGGWLNEASFLEIISFGIQFMPLSLKL